jgi:hypothetical protein
VVGVKGKEGFFVNYVENNMPSSFYLRDGCYEDIMRRCPGILEVIWNLEVEGIMMDGKHHAVQSCMGRDLKLLNGWMGLCGCSSKYPCIYCKARKEHLLMTKSALGGFCGQPMRTVQEMTQMAHVVLDCDYVCPAPGALLWYSIANCRVCVCVCVCVCDLLINYVV